MTQCTPVFVDIISEIITPESISKSAKDNSLTGEIIRDYVLFILSLPNRMHNLLQKSTPLVFTAEYVRNSLTIAGFGCSKYLTFYKESFKNIKTESILISQACFTFSQKIVRKFTYYS